jgi:hypothetical protein
MDLTPNKPKPEKLQPMTPARLDLEGFSNQTWILDLAHHKCVDGSKATLAHIWHPPAWSKTAALGKIKVGDLVRVRDGGDGCDFEVSVVWVGAGGIGVRLFPHRPRFVDEAFAKVQREQFEIQAALNEKQLGLGGVVQ